MHRKTWRETLTCGGGTDNARLSAMFDVLSVNDDKQGRTFVSTIEGKKLPFYGVQWHPEKAM